jgi:hypothetical protein
MGEIEDEAVVPKIPPSPILPTEQEVQQHDITHLPFRSWCPHCVSGKARNRPHRKLKDKVHQVPNIVVDYCFLKGEGDEESLIVQVARDEESSYLFAHAVPRKGLTHIHGAAELVKDIERLFTRGGTGQEGRANDFGELTCGRIAEQWAC